MSKSSFKTCNAGHFYPSSKSSCPFCNNSSSNSNDNDKTEFTAERNISIGDKTEIIDNGPKVSPLDKTHQINKPSHTPADGKTVIFSSEDSTKKSSLRKLVGWIVSFTLNEYGADFRLYEDKNSIGRGMDCNIRITEDNLLSSTHATFLYRNGNIYMQDNMASNPSFINGEELMPGSTQILNDGDLVMIGSNEYLLRKAVLK